MATSKKSPEYVTIRSNFHNICQKISQIPSSITPLTNDLASIKVIGESTQSSVIYRKGCTPYEQASELLSAVHVSIEFTSTKFYDFVDKLEEHSHESLAKKLYADCESQGGRPVPPSSSTTEAKNDIDFSHPSLQTSPNLIHLTNWIATPLIDKWRDIGIQLGLRPAQMDAIYDQRNRVASQCYMDIFEQWEKLGIVPFTWCEMLKALCSPALNQRELANEVYGKIINTSK